jgi:hypothetical protein
MPTVSADTAGKALRVIGEKLLTAGIVTAEGKQVLTEESFKLTKLAAGTTSWTTEIPRGRPIIFERIPDKNGDQVSIILSADKITVDQAAEHLPPFSRLDVSVAMTHVGDQPVCRWHLDRANDAQAGPLFHLQYGGHLPGFRDRELPIDVPRWCHPPMELGLLCEVIAANFFEKLWSKTLRDDPAWCRAIQHLQKLCFTAYAKRLVESVTISESTALSRMWNGRWL